MYEGDDEWPWQLKSACAGQSILFDEARTALWNSYVKKQAKATCASCPVFLQCTEDVIRIFRETEITPAVFQAGKNQREWRKFFGVRAAGGVTKDVPIEEESA